MRIFIDVDKKLDFPEIFHLLVEVWIYKHSSLQSKPAPHPLVMLFCTMKYLSLQIAKAKTYRTWKFFQELSLYLVYDKEVGNLIS